MSSLHMAVLVNGQGEHVHVVCVNSLEITNFFSSTVIHNDSYISTTYLSTSTSIYIDLIPYKLVDRACVCVGGGVTKYFSRQNLNKVKA